MAAGGSILAAGGSACNPGPLAGHAYMVAGHTVQFPHKAYGTQLSFMNQARASSPSAHCKHSCCKLGEEQQAALSCPFQCLNACCVNGAAISINRGPQSCCT